MDSARPEPLVASSTTIGKYRLIAALGSGGMANVYLAVMKGRGGFNKLVVLKIPRPEVVDNPSALAMFLDEARLAARLNHPNIVQTFEVINEDGVEIMVMEYLDGYTLNETVHRSRRQQASIPEAVHLRILSEALTGLHYAHEAKDLDGTPLAFVHRDFSPHNIFVSFDGQVKVLDFGVAKAATQSNKTEYGTFKGKVRYMPVEQLTGRDVDRRADVFAAGAMVWEAAVGQRLWRERSDVEVMTAVISGEIPFPKDVNADVPEALDAICRKAMAFKKEDRYASCLELQADIDAYLAALPEKPSIRDAVRHMEKVFEEPRAARRKFIDEQLKTVDLAGPPVPLAALPAPSLQSLPSLNPSSVTQGTPPTGVSSALHFGPPGASLSTTSSGVVAASGDIEERKESKWRLLPVALLALVLVFVIGLVVVPKFTGQGSEEAISAARSDGHGTGAASTANASASAGLGVIPGAPTTTPDPTTGAAPSAGTSADAAAVAGNAASTATANPTAAGKFVPTSRPAGASTSGHRPTTHAGTTPSTTTSPPSTTSTGSETPSKPKRDCSNPFYINERGVRSVFPECL